MNNQSMTIDELHELLKILESDTFRTTPQMLNAAKYIDITIDTRDMSCFSVNIRPWFVKDKISLSTLNNEKDNNKPFLERILDYFTNRTNKIKELRNEY